MMIKLFKRIAEIVKVIILHTSKNVKIENCYLVLTIVFLIILSPSQSTAAVPMKIISSEMHMNLDSYMGMYRDTEKNLMSADIILMNNENFFPVNGMELPVSLLSSDVFWIRFSMDNRLIVEHEWYLEIPNPHLKSIILYTFDENFRLIDERKSGSRYNFDMRVIRDRNFIFKLTEKPLKIQHYLLMVQPDPFMKIKIIAYSAAEFHERNNILPGVAGIFFGALFALVLYNLFIFIAIRDPGNLLFVFYYSALTLLHISLSGFGFKYVWPGFPWWNSMSVPVFIIACLVLSILFISNFLNLKSKIPVAARIIKTLIISYLVFFPSVFFADHAVVIIIFILIIIANFIFISYMILNIAVFGFRTGKFFLLSFCFFCLSVLIYIFRYYSIIPANNITMLIFQGASLVEIVTISLGLVDRIHMKKVETESQNIELENLVNKRTEELNAAVTRMEWKDKIIQRELDLAKNIQLGILPELPYKGKGIRIDAIYRAMSKVSGDFFDIFSMSGGYTGVIIGDVSGHGMPAAFITAMAKINFSSAIQNNLFPSDIFREVNTNLVNIIKTDDFLTAFAVVISPSFEIIYGNASHLLPMLLRKKDFSVSRLDTDGLFLGVMPEANKMFTDGMDRMDYGDRLILFTDGITESKNIHKEAFGEERLSKLLIGTASLAFEDAKDKIFAEWNSFVKGVEQFDDICLVMIEIDPDYKMLVSFRDDGFRLLVEGQLDESIKILGEALDIDNNDEKTHLYLGECHLKKRNYPEAVEHLNRYLANNDIDGNVWFHLAQAYFNMGDSIMANRAAIKASQIRSESSDVLVISGLSLRDLGQHDEAEKIWKRLLSLEPYNPLALAELDKIKRIKNKTGGI